VAAQQDASGTVMQLLAAKTHPKKLRRIFKLASASDTHPTYARCDSNCQSQHENRYQGLSNPSSKQHENSQSRICKQQHQRRDLFCFLFKIIATAAGAA
jgi:hypothetical protein